MSTTAEQETSIAYNAGVSARQDGIDIKKSALKNLLPGCQQWHDFIAGYDSLDQKKPAGEAQQ